MPAGGPWDVAIVGLACRFPGAASAAEFWRNLAGGVEAIAHFSDDELTAAGVDPALLGHPDYVKAAPVLDDHDGFDAALFGYSPREARLMDPQHRLFLEVAWEALEDSGYDPLGDKGIVGIYAGAGGLVSSYALRHDHPELRGQTGDLGHIGNDRDFLPSRVAFKLDLKGPCVNVQTACSTSLVAVHLACQGLAQGEAETALAGASVVRVPHVSGYLAEPGGIHSRDGHCRPFAADASGTLFGSGVAAVLLKPLAAALAAGDRIYAVIKGSAVTNDGGAKFSYTAASADGQARAMAEALRRAAVPPETIGYVECHGTATALGDPVEIQALTRAFHGRAMRCPIGSVKSNFGHLEQCAGLAGLIKTVLALERGQIPPSINFTAPNPRIPFDRSPFFVNTELQRFERDASPRRAAVNSVGMGGTNAFVVLEEAPVPSRAPRRERALFALALSAASEPALATQVARCRAALGDAEAPALDDWCFTANLGRHHFPHRHCVVGADRDELRRELDGWKRDAMQRRRGPLVYLFSGQGAQRPHMGEALYRAEPAFSAAFDRCFTVFAAAGIDLPPVLFGDDPSSLARTLYAQPALFALQIGLTELWRHWGIEADAVIGHSVGEFAAAAAAGAVSVEDGARLVAHRALAMDELSQPGGMVSIAATFDAVRALWPAELDLAAENASDRIVAAGDAQAIAAFVERLREAGIVATRLNTSHAFHSALMEPALPTFAAAAAAIPFAAPGRRWISTLTGAEMTAPPDALYWRDQIRQPVRFRQALAAVEQPDSIYLEIGPGTTLSTLARRSIQDRDAPMLASLRVDKDEQRSMLEALAGLYRYGREVRWSALEPAHGRRAALPLYPFQHQRFWIGLNRPPTVGAPEPPPLAIAHPLFGAPLTAEPAGYRTLLSIDQHAFLGEHRVFNRIVLPMAAILDAALFAASRSGMTQPMVTDLVYQAALLLATEQPVEVRLSLERRGFQLTSAAAGEGDHWRLHAGGTIAEDREPPALAPFPVLRARRAATVPAPSFYEGLAERGLHYGLAFRSIRDLRRDGDEAFAEVSFAPGLDASGWRVHPVFLDACLHIYAALADPAPGTVPVPVGIESFHLWRSGLRRARVHAVVVERAAADRLKLDIRIYGEDGRPAAWLRGLAVRALGEAAFLAGAGSGWQRLLYGVRWAETAAPISGAPATRDCCILADRGGIGERLADQLAQRGARSALMGAETFLADVPAGVEAVLYLGALDGTAERSGREIATDALAAMQKLAALRDSGRAAPRLWLVTCGAQGEAPTALSQSPLWGLARSFALEYPDLRGGLVDLPPEADPAAAAALLLRELCAGDGEDQVIWRDGRRFALRLAPLAGAVGTVAPELRPDASYWMVGGLGRLGRLTAEALVDAGARHLVLTGRRAPDPDAAAMLDRLRQRAEIHLVAADITCETAVREAVERFGRTMPPLKGVIHTAAVFEDALITKLTPEALARVLRPKVEGAWALHRATAGLDLDFFVLFSSILGLWGAAGQGAYAAGNSFLDALAHHRRANGLPATVFDWGPWEDLAAAGRWGSVTEAMWKQRATEPLSAREALGIMLRLRAGGPAQVAVIDSRWGRFARQFAALPPLYREVAPLSESDAAGLDGGIEDGIRRHAASVLGIASIDQARPLTELGLDSLLAVTLANRLRQSLGLSVPVARLLKGASVADLASELRPDPPRPDDQGTAGLGSRWLIVHRPRPAARARLVCFPFAGGGAATFRSWAERLDRGIELVAIEPPGRQTRLDEPPIREIDAFTSALAPELLPLLDQPFAVYGHCLGTLTLFETVRELIDRHGRAPAHIFVSGARPPDELHRHQQFETALTDRLLALPDYTVFEPLYNQPDAVFAEAMQEFRVPETERLLASPDLRQLMLPTIRAEFAMGENYRFRPTPPWDVPITCLTGRNDTYVTLENAQGWSRFTQNRFELHTLDSEHFIVVEDDRAVLDVINRAMASLA